MAAILTADGGAAVCGRFRYSDLKEAALRGGLCNFYWTTAGSKDLWDWFTGCVGGRAVEHANKPGAESSNRWWVGWLCWCHGRDETQGLCACRGKWRDRGWGCGSCGT